MKQINFSAPLNSLSFGNVSYNILRELFNRDIEVAYHPIGAPDLTAFQPTQEFVNKLNAAIGRRYDFLDAPTLKLWHFSDGGETRIGRGKSYLFTFHETSEATNAERSVARIHDGIIVSSTYTRDIFANAGLEQIHYVPLGLDSDFSVLQNPKRLKGRTHWGLMGKWEKRKNTKKIISEWAKKFGNSPKHHLTCAIVNPFLQPEALKAQIHEAVGGKQYSNIQFLNHMKTNAEVNDFLNSIDIDLSGLSSAEGFCLPGFNATALGKWSCVHNVTAMRDWAREDNSILVQPSGEMESVEDGVFFRNGAPFNQGNVYSLSAEQIVEAFARAESKIGTVNTQGLKLGMELNYKNTVDEILKVINNLE